MFYSPDKQVGRSAIVNNILHLLITRDANAGLVLLAVGTLGIYAEFCAPGRIAPGVLGASLVVVALASLAAFPVGWAGVLLTLLSFLFFFLEARYASRGLLTVAGAAVLLAGLRMLIDTPDTDLRVSWMTASCVAIPFAAITSFLFSAAFRARRNKVYMLKESELKS